MCLDSTVLSRFCDAFESDARCVAKELDGRRGRLCADQQSIVVGVDSQQTTEQAPSNQKSDPTAVPAAQADRLENNITLNTGHAALTTYPTRRDPSNSTSTSDDRSGNRFCYQCTGDRLSKCDTVSITFEQSIYSAQRLSSVEKKPTDCGT